MHQFGTELQASILLLADSFGRPANGTSAGMHACCKGTPIWNREERGKECRLSRCQAWASAHMQLSGAASGPRLLLTVLVEHYTAMRTNSPPQM